MAGSPAAVPWVGPYPEQPHHDSQREGLTSAPDSSLALAAALAGAHPPPPAPPLRGELGALLFSFCLAVSALDLKLLQGGLPFPQLHQ